MSKTLRSDTVVLVEEDPQQRARAESAISARGYRVCTPVDAGEVLDCVRSAAAGVVVLGLTEDSNTLDLIRRLRGRFEPIPLPIPPRIVATVGGMGEGGERFARSLGADVVLRRPFTAGDLAAALDRLAKKPEPVPVSAIHQAS